MTGPAVKKEATMPSTSTPTAKTFKAVARALGREIAQAKHCDVANQEIVNGVLGAVMDGFKQVAPRFDEGLFRREFMDAVYTEQASWTECIGYNCGDVCFTDHINPAGECVCVQCAEERLPADS